jgi:hypothetical protein
MTDPVYRGPSDDVRPGRVEESVPAMPVVREVEKSTLPYPLVDGIPRTLGWQWRSEAKGGPEFVIMTRGAMGGLKVQERFPFTEDGWRNAWQSLARSDGTAAAKVAARLEKRAADAAAASAAAVQLPRRFGLLMASRDLLLRLTTCNRARRERSGLRRRGTSALVRGVARRNAQHAASMRLWRRRLSSRTW